MKEASKYKSPLNPEIRQNSRSVRINMKRIMR